MNPLQYARRNPFTTAAALAPAALYGANALASGGGEDWDRTLGNTAGNMAGGLAGAAAGSRFGVRGAIAGGLAGALGGGYASDFIGNQFDENDGRANAAALLELHLQSQDPYQQEVQLRQQLQANALLQQRQEAAQAEQDRINKLQEQMGRSQMAMQMYQ